VLIPDNNNTNTGSIAHRVFVEYSIGLRDYSMKAVKQHPTQYIHYIEQFLFEGADARAFFLRG